jgi:hypothetical protein
MALDDHEVAVSDKSFNVTSSKDLNSPSSASAQRNGPSVQYQTARILSSAESHEITY